METNPYLTISGALLGFVVASGFAWQIHFHKLKVNIATWAMVLVLDFVGLGLLLAADNHEPYIQIGWCLAATLIFTAAVINRGDWNWGPIESWSVIACGLAVCIWLFTGSVWSLLGYMGAVCISIIPQVMQYWYEARWQRAQTAWVWGFSTLAIAITMLGSPATANHMIVLTGFLFINAGMTWLTLRRD